MPRVSAVPALALALMVVACAGRPQWSKEGAEEAEVKSAHSECRDEARSATAADRQIDYDIQAANPAPGARGQQLFEDLRFKGTQNRYDDVFDR